ncbi:MAG: metallophosphoesterase [Clostridia bacterium]|nr:metallophosphoesterase [Clostridia bacterium]
MSIISLFKRLIAIVCTSVLFVSAGSVAQYSPKSDDIRLNVALLSDVHMESNNMDCFKNFGSALKGVFSTGKELNAVVFAGDCTMNGQGTEWFDFYGMLCRFNKADNVILAFGNHDFGFSSSHEVYDKLSQRAIDEYNSYMNKHIENVFYSEVIKGYRFIVLGTEDNYDNETAYITDKQIEWLKGELSAAANTGMPAFVINHNVIYGKHGELSNDINRISNNNGKLNDALTMCGTDVIYISGHTRMGVTKDSVTTQGRVTYVNLPSVSQNNKKASGIYAAATNGCIMEVYDDSIILRFRCFGSGQWLDGYENIVIPISNEQ